MHTCACIHSYIHTYIHMHTYIHTYIHTYMHAYYIHSHTYIHTYACIHTYMHTYACIHKYIHTYICMHAYIHTYICMHAYIHTYAYKQTYICIQTNIHTSLCSYGQPLHRVATARASAAGHFRAARSCCAGSSGMKKGGDKKAPGASQAIAHARVHTRAPELAHTSPQMRVMCWIQACHFARPH